MKNLPERELFNELENRLRGYTEEPDENSWDKIAEVIHPDRAKRSTAWFERTTDALAVLLLLFLLWNAGNEVIQTTPSSSQPPHTSDELMSQDKGNVSSSKIPEDKDVLPEKENLSTGHADGFALKKMASEGDKVKHNASQALSGYADAEENSMERLLRNENDPDKQSDQLRQTNVSENIPVRSDSVFAKVIRPDSVVAVPANVQEKKEKKKLRKRTQLYFTASPSMAFQKMIPMENDQVVVKGVVPESMMSSNRLGISLEAGFQRSIRKKLEIYGGVSYYQQDQKITYEYQNGSVSVEDGSDDDFVVSPAVEQKEFNYKMRNLGISAGAFYQIKGGKLQHKAGIGFQYHQGMAKTSDESAYDNSASVYLNYQLSYRLQFMVNKRTSVFLQPNFTHSFYAKEKLDQPFELKPYRAGVGFGLLYSF